jgi:hypothetical protein
LLLMVLERPIFTCLPYSKDIMLYSDTDSLFGWRRLASGAPLLECDGSPPLFSLPRMQ